MPWIAAEYGLRLSEDYQVRPSCFTGVGDKEDINKEVCWSVYLCMVYGRVDESYSIIFDFFISHEGLSLGQSVTLVQWSMQVNYSILF